MLFPSIFQGSSIYSPSAAKNYGSVNVFEKQVENIPVKRLGTPEEVLTTMFKF